MPHPIATLLSAKMATLNELQTVYGVQDMYDMLEVLSIDNYNQRKMIEHG